MPPIRPASPSRPCRATAGPRTAGIRIARRDGAARVDQTAADAEQQDQAEQHARAPRIRPRPPPAGARPARCLQGRSPARRRPAPPRRPPWSLRRRPAGPPARRPRPPGRAIAAMAARARAAVATGGRADSRVAPLPWAARRGAVVAVISGLPGSSRPASRPPRPRRCTAIASRAAMISADHMADHLAIVAAGQEPGPDPRLGAGRQLRDDGADQRQGDADLQAGEQERHRGRPSAAWRTVAASWRQIGPHQVELQGVGRAQALDHADRDRKEAQIGRDDRFRASAR